MPDDSESGFLFQEDTVRDRTFPKHVHQWVEFLPRKHERTTFVICELCAKNNRDNMLYLGREATAEFRRQIKAGIKPRFKNGRLIGYAWEK